MKGKDALSKALVMFVEGEPVINVRASSHVSDSDTWVIELKHPDGEYQTIRELPKGKTE